MCRKWSLVLAVVVMVGAGESVFAQSSRGTTKNSSSAKAPVRETAAQMEARGVRAMGEGDWAGAEDVFLELIERRPGSFVGYYNLASAMSRQGKVEGAVDAIIRALGLGFTDRRQLARDADLVALRGSAFYADLMDGWGEVVEARRSADLTRMDNLVHAKIMQHRTIDDLRLEVVSAHDPISTDQAVAELELITAWAEGEVFGGLEKTLGMGGGEDSAWVMVGLPERRGFGKWALETFGPGVRGGISSVGGAYEHQQRRLVAQDLGATLRHEFVHVLHWRDMSRLGQNHAPWIQEGLASVVEDYDTVGTGGGVKLVPMASWRTNMVKRLLKVRKLPRISELAGMDLSTFTGRKPLARYAQARTILMWLLDRGELGAFYETYVESYREDPTGVLALERTVGMGIDDVEVLYRAWVGELMEVPETGSDLEATLGVSIENGSGVGVVIKKVSGEARRRTGLRMGSVITGIEGRATRDLHELIRVLGSYGAGDVVLVSWRRGTIHGENEVELLGR